MKALLFTFLGLTASVGVRAADYAAATNALVQTVLKTPLHVGALAGVRTPVDAVAWELITPMRRGSYAIPYASAWVFQVDDADASEHLMRPRTLVVMADDLSAFVTYSTRVPAFLRRKTDGFETMLKTLNDDEIPRGVLPRNAAQANAFAPLTDTDNNTNLYAVLISGGVEPAENGIRFYNDVRFAYQTLHGNYAVPRENIFTFIASGVESNKEHLVTSTYKAVDYDLDGDGTKDVNGGAYRETISACLAALAKKLTAADRLLIVLTTHGSPFETETVSDWRTVAWLWGDCVSDEEFCAWTDDIACPVAFALQQCYSGGFADDVIRAADRVVGAAANHLESSWGYTGASGYNLYLYNFFTALSGGSARTFYDAARAAYAGENLIAHPQYAESTARLGYAFRFDARTPSAESYASVAYDTRDVAAVCLTTNFDYRADADIDWMPDAFSTNGFHDTWSLAAGKEDVFVAHWIPYSRTNDTPIVGMSGTAAAQIAEGESFRWVWTAPKDGSLGLSLARSVASGTLTVSNDTALVTQASGSSEWPQVTFTAVAGTRYTITVTSSAAMLARLAWHSTGALYVATSGDDANDGTPESPLRTIQAAVNSAAEGAMIYVAAGRYEPFHSSNKNVCIESLQGATMTFIDGGGTNCCADMLYASYRDGATQLVGFTLENGYSYTTSPYSDACGGGARGGTLVRCIIRNCTAQAGGWRDVFGAATYCGFLYNCLVYGNTAITTRGRVYGGACYGTDLYGSTVADNAAMSSSGTVYGGALYTFGDYVGGNLVWTYGWACNSIVVGTTVSAPYVVGENTYYENGEGLVKTYSGGDPKFVDRANGDYRLAADSPCVDAGYDDWTTGDAWAEEGIDLDGNVRIQGGAVDLGCYESASVAPTPEVPTTTPTRRGRHYGVFVGVNDYAAGLSLHLGGCVHDAESMLARCLASGYWHAEDVTVLTNAYATESAVRAAIADYAARTQAGDTFIYTHSGHGNNCYDDQTAAYLCMHDCGVGSAGSDGYYCDSELAADLKCFPEGVRVIVVLDACRSGGMFKTWQANDVAANDCTLLGVVAQAEETVEAWDFASRVRAAMNTPRVASSAPAGARVLSGVSTNAAVATNIAFITAADYDQYSWDGSETIGGIFTTSFADGWASGAADANEDAKLDFYELYAHAASIATGQWVHVTYRTEAQCDNAGLLAATLAGYVPNAWPQPEITPSDTPEERATKVQDAMIGAGFPPSTAKAVTNAADYAALRAWSEQKDVPLSAMAQSPVALLSPALGADELLDDLTSNDVQVVSVAPVGTTMWKLALAITDYDPAKVNESLLKSAVGVTGSSEVDGTFSTDDVQLQVEKGDETVNLTVSPPANAPRYFMRALVR